MTSDRDCFVFVALPGRSEYVVAGRFRGVVASSGARLGEFVYGRSYLSRPDAVELDPVQLRLTEDIRKTSEFNGLFGAIRDTMPTTWGRPIIEGDSRGKIPDELAYSVKGPDECVGALVFAPGLEPPRFRRPFRLIDDLARLQGAVEAMLATQDARLEMDTPQVAMSVQKHRPKAIVADDRTLWVAKFVQEHTVWNQARVRHATMQLARDCGLNVAASRIERIRGNDILLVRRLDREWAGDGYACSRMISGLTFLGTGDTPAEKNRWSYLTLADEVRRTSSHPREDLRELFRRMCFNAAISNLNDDLRQFIMVAKGPGWRLAPASALAPTPLADGDRGDFTMVCGPQGCSPTRENIVGGAGRFLLNRPAAEGIFDRIGATVRSRWREVMRRSGVSVQDCELVGRGMVGGEDGRGSGRRAANVYVMAEPGRGRQPSLPTVRQRLVAE